MYLSRSKLLQKAAGYMLAAANAGIREEKQNLKKIKVQTVKTKQLNTIKK
jgi:hypothetical protein